MKKTGFTLIELLIVIGIIAVLAGVVLVAINPAAQFGKANDAERKSEISSVLSAVYQFQTSPSSRGALPECNVGATPTATAIPECDADGSGSAGNGLYEGAIELGNQSAAGIYNCNTILTPNFIREIPIDPSGTEASTGYYICKQIGAGGAADKIVVLAPNAEVFTDDGGCYEPGSTTVLAMCISG